METYYRYNWATACKNNALRHYVSNVYEDKTVAEIMFHKVCFKDKTKHGTLYEIKKQGEKKHYEIIETYYNIG